MVKNCSMECLRARRDKKVERHCCMVSEGLRKFSNPVKTDTHKEKTPIIQGRPEGEVEWVVDPNDPKVRAVLSSKIGTRRPN